MPNVELDNDTDLSNAPTSGFPATSLGAAYLNKVHSFINIARIWNQNLANNYLLWFNDTYLVELQNRFTTDPPHNPPVKWEVIVPESNLPNRQGKPKDPNKGDSITQEELDSIDIVRSSDVLAFVCPIPLYTIPPPVENRPKFDPLKGATSRTAPPGDTVPIGTILTDPTDGSVWIRRQTASFMGTYNYYDRIG